MRKDGREMRNPKLSIFLGLLILVVRIVLAKEKSFDYPEGTKLRITGRVASEPRVFGGGFRYKLGEFEILSEHEVDYGDKVQAIGTFKKGRLEAEQMELISESTGQGILQLLHEFKQWAIGTLQKNLPEPEASLVAGLLLGAKESLPTDFYQALRRTGTTHVVVASGTNVAYVGALVAGLFAYFAGRKGALVIASVAIWTFAAMAGFEAPVVRAAIMGSLAYVATILGRSTNGLAILLFAGWGMIMIRPEWLGQLSFQLSFAATLGVILAGGKLSGVPTGIKETLMAQLLTLPVILTHLGLGAVSWVAPLANFLVLGLVGPLMILGGILLLLAAMNLGVLIQLWAAVTYVMAHLFVLIINWLV